MQEILKQVQDDELNPMTKFTVNDRPVWYRMDPETPLLWALRDASNLTGTKYGCGTGDCGACVVEVDGSAAIFGASQVGPRKMCRNAAFANPA